MLGMDDTWRNHQSQNDENKHSPDEHLRYSVCVCVYCGVILRVRERERGEEMENEIIWRMRIMIGDD